MSSPRVVRGGLAALILLGVLALLATILVRRALDLAILRPMVEARLSAALGQPVSIGKMDASLWPTPVIDGREITIGAGAGTRATGPSLALTAIRIVPRVSSLFSKPIVIERVDIEGLTLDARRDRDGRWLLPMPAAAHASSTDGADATAVDVGRLLLKGGGLRVTDDRAPASGARKVLTDLEAGLRLTGGTVFLDRMTAKVGGSTIVGQGTASVRGLTLSVDWKSLAPTDLPQVFALLGLPPIPGLSLQGERPLSLQLAIDQGGGASGSGRLAASRVSFGTLGLSSLASPVRLGGNRLTLDPLTFALYGGRQRGALSVDIATMPLRWFFRSEVEGVDVNQLLSANTPSRNKLSGVGGFRADVRGTAETPVERTLAGTLEAEVVNGVIHDFPLLAALNTALRLGTSGDSRDLRFETLSATLRLAGARASTDDLLARSGDLMVAAAGTIGFDQSLDLTGRARFTREKSDELVRRAKDLGGLRNPQGEIEVPFAITGTAASPAFSIDIAKVLSRAASKEMKRQLDRQLKKWIKIK